MPDWLGWLVTFVFLSSTIVFMRPSSLLAAVHMLWRLLPHGHVLGYSALRDLLPLTPATLFRPVAFGVVLAFFFKSSMGSSRASRPSLRPALACLFLFVIPLFYMTTAPERTFLYFAF